MVRVREYHRPETVAEALELLARPGVTSVPLAGGTTLVPRLVAADNEVEAVIDLRRLNLDFIELEGEVLRLGATTTLADVAKSETCCQVAGGLLSHAARLNGAVNVRNAATVGGVIVEGDPTSELLLTMLLLGGDVVLQRSNDAPRLLSLSAFLDAQRGALDNGLLLEVRFLVPEGRVGTGLVRLGRTPRDRPIVAAAVVLVCEGDVAAQVGLAMSGVASMPMRLDRVEKALKGQTLTGEVLEEALSGLEGRLNPPDDFRGSAEYRRAMASVLARRALQEAWAMVMDSTD